MKTNIDRSVLRWVYEVAGDGRKWVLITSLVRMLQSGSTILYAYLMRTLVDSAAAGDRDSFVQYLIAFVSLVLFTILLQTCSRYVLEKANAVLEKNYRSHFFEQLMLRDYAKVSQTHTGEWMNRITSDTAVVISAVTAIIPRCKRYDYSSDWSAGLFDDYRSRDRLYHNPCRSSHAVLLLCP